MNGVDVIVLLVVAFSAMLGFMRGMVREVLGLGAWIGAGVTAYVFFPQAQGFMRKAIPNPDLADPIAFGTVFLVILLLLSVIARMMSRGVRKAGLGGLGPHAGAALRAGARAGGDHRRLYRGQVCWSRWRVGPIWSWKPAPCPPFIWERFWVAGHLPDVYKPVLAVPPAARPTPAADLLQATPMSRTPSVSLLRR